MWETAGAFSITGYELTFHREKGGMTYLSCLSQKTTFIKVGNVMAKWQLFYLCAPVRKTR